MTTGATGQAPDLDTVRRVTGAVRQNIERVIAGKPDVVNAALVVLLAEGHLLIEDVPGVGKTQLSKALARSIDCSVRRIQFTPDLLPSDVTGVSVFNQDTREFEFRPGGVFANIVVGDEINRASPKTQSALLEAMAERQVPPARTIRTGRWSFQSRCGQGLAGAVISAAVRDCLDVVPALGPPMVSLGMYASNDVARRVYTRLGFRLEHRFDSRHRAA